MFFFSFLTLGFYHVIQFLTNWPFFLAKNHRPMNFIDRWSVKTFVGAIWALWPILVHMHPQTHNEYLFFIFIKIRSLWTYFKMDIMWCTNWKEKHSHIDGLLQKYKFNNINICLLTQSNYSFTFLYDAIK